MERINPPDRGPIVAIAAHPDDIDSWCAGTIARAIDAGSEARLLLVTSGDRGSNDPAADRRVVAMEREREARESARRLGLTEVAFLQYPDGELEETVALRRDIVAWLRRWRPWAVFTLDPENAYPPYLSHRDHRVVGRAVLDCVYPLARDPLAFPEQALAGLAPHTVREVWLGASTAATVVVDISATFERKIAARLAHVSQTPDPARLPQDWRTRAATIGAAAGVGLGEAFTVLRLD